MSLTKAPHPMPSQASPPGATAPNPPPRPRPWVRPAAMTVFALAPLIGYLAPLGLWAPWVVLLVMIGVEAGQARQVPWAGGAMALVKRPLSWLLLVPLLGVLTAPWALLPGLAAGRAAGLVLQITVAIMVALWLHRLPHRQRCSIVAAAVLSATLVGALMVLDVAVGAPLNILLHGDRPYVIAGGSASRGAVLHALLLFPGVAALWAMGRRPVALVVLVLGLGILAKNTSDTAVLGALAGLGLGGLLALAPVLGRALSLLAMVTIFAMPWAVPTLKDAAYCQTIIAAPSIAHRLAIWETVRGLILDRPWLGWGVDSARAAPGGKDLLELRACDAAGNPTGKVEVIGESIPLHPHNGAMDLWFSLGGIGVLTLCFGLWRAYRGAFRAWPGRLGAATIGATSAILFVTALLGYGLWQGWFAAALCLSLTTIAMVPSRPCWQRSAPVDTQETLENAPDQS